MKLKNNYKDMKYILKNKEIELTEEEVAEIVKQNQAPVEEKKLGIAIKNRFTGEIIFQSTKTTYKEAIDEKGDKNLHGANLRGANLYGADLSGADLSGADLIGAELSGADLSGADLIGAELSGAELSGADLSGADLYGADLSGADLRCADLSGADLYGADLQNAKFYGRGGTQVIKKANLEGFLGALGFVLEE
jgi:uncharacterized protein YjbI with pentapeptide repeats